jgi:DNA-directed RNA polymerase I subunit RPA2
MAGKGGALHGLVHDATPFKFSEDDSAIDYFGKLLDKGKFESSVTPRIMAYHHCLLSYFLA